MQIIGYNVIEQIVTNVDNKDPSDMNLLLSANLNQSTSINTDALINFIKSTSEREQSLCAVKTNKNITVIPGSKSVIISCRANTGFLDSKTPVLFEPEQSDCVPQGLEIEQTVLTLRGGTSSNINVQITNKTQHLWAILTIRLQH